MILFQEIQAHLLEDDAPSEYFNRIMAQGLLDEYPFSMLSRLKNVPQSPTHHPEGDVWNHTMLVVDQAARMKQKSRDPLSFMWAALLHDLGKAETTAEKKGRITAYNHEKVGAHLAEQFFHGLLEEKKTVLRITALIRWHMQILFVIKSMQFADMQGMLSEIEPDEIALLGYCDRMGRLNADRKAEMENLRIFMEACREFLAKTQRISTISEDNGE